MVWWQTLDRLLKRRMIRRRRRCGGRVLGLLFLAGWGVAGADGGLSLEARRLVGENLTVEGLKLGLDWRPQGHSLVLQGQRLRIGPFEGRALHLECAGFLLYEGGSSACPQAEIRLDGSPWSLLEGRLQWTPDRLVLESLRMGKGRLDGQLQRQGEEARFQLQGHRLALAPWLKLLAPRWSGDGRFQLALDGELGPEAWTSKGSLAVLGVDFSDAEGLHVGESLVGRLEGRLQGGTGLAGSLTLSLEQGQLYLDPFYLAFIPKRPLEATLSWQGRSDLEAGRLTALRLALPQVLSLSGEGDWRRRALTSLDLDFELQDLAAVYGAFLQPLLIGGPLDALTLSGRAEGRLAWRLQGLEALDLTLAPTALEDEAGRFEVQALTASLSWRRQGPPREGRLGWRRARLYAIDLGPLEASFRLDADRLRLAPVSLALLGGRLSLTQGVLAGWLEGVPRGTASARLQGIRLDRLAQALGWPPLAGVLDADIPRVRFDGHALILEGALVVEVFGGRVVIEGLRIDDLLGAAPVLTTRIRLEGLDLEQISSTFAFGRIQGSLSGTIDGLRLVGWTVAAFEADLHSPPDDPRPHRISQGAIDDLTELGNGMAAGLSGTFLGIFKDFAYDRMVLRVTLQGDTAEMSGVPAPQGGYYIVKGAGLPRVDVIGRNHRVAWKDLLSRLRDIRFDGVVVE